MAPQFRTASADSICTIAMLKGLDALDFLEREAMDYLAVDAQGEVHRKG